MTDGSNQQLNVLKNAIFNTEDAHQTKIQFIKEALAENRYQIHSTRIAEKLLEHVRQEQTELA